MAGGPRASRGLGPHFAFNPAPQSFSPSESQVNAVVASASVNRWGPVEEALAQGLSPAAQDSKLEGSGAGCTLLHWAAFHGRVDWVQALVTAGACLEARDVHGVTALWRCACQGTAAALQALVTAGCDVNAVQAGGVTPLVALVGHDIGEREDVPQRLQVLLSCPALDLDRDVKGRPALVWAMERGRLQHVAALRSEMEHRGRWGAHRQGWLSAVIRTGLRQTPHPTHPSSRQ